MSTIFIDPSDGMIAVRDSYNDRAECSAAGCFWDGEAKLWKMVFTLSTFETLLEKLPNAYIDKSVGVKLEAQKKKEDKLTEIRKLAKDNTDISFRIPNLNATLYPYQKLGVLYASISQNGLLIGDQCGLGKSIEGIATALVMKSRGLAKNCLIVTPASLKYNWPLEIKKFTNESYTMIDGKTPEKRIAQWLDKSAFFKVVNYELVVEDLFGGREYKEKKNETKEQKEKREAKIARQSRKQSILSEVKNSIWDVLIMDELHFCKNFSAARSKALKAIRAKIKIGLTGTPMDGKLEELYTVMNIIAPGVLGSVISFLARHVVKDFHGNVKGYKNIQEVQEKIAPFFLRRLKEDVLKQLPEKTYENKIIALSDEEMKIYNDIKNGKHHSVKDAEPMVRAIRCMQFCNFPQMIEPSCKNSTKLDVFRDCIEELVQMNGQKIIVFTQYKQLLDVVDSMFKELKLKFLRIDGDTDKKLRSDYQKLFNEDNSIDAIIGTDAMSTGLTLNGATNCIHLTQSWQPSVMEQRENRNHRIGQKENVLVINLLCKGTIEEKMRIVLYSKDKTTAETLGDGTDESVLRKLSPQEFERLM